MQIAFESPTSIAMDQLLEIGGKDNAKFSFGDRPVAFIFDRIGRRRNESDEFFDSHDVLAD